MDITEQVVDNTTIEEKIFNWCSGTYIPETKEEEDTFLLNAYKHINTKGKKNPGQLGEYAVKKCLIDIGIPEEVIGDNIKVSCDWIPGQKNIKPDHTLPGHLVETKTLRYYNNYGNRGNQGSADEKMSNIITKYANASIQENKKIVVIFVADQISNKYGKLYLDAFNHQQFNNNIRIENDYNMYKTSFKFITFSDISMDIFN
jgi:hypothetical protein